MVQVHSTWFPLYDRNPQTWVANIFEARESDFRGPDTPPGPHARPRHPSPVTFQAPD